MLAFSGLAVLVASALLVHSEPVPNVPGPNDKYTAGQTCTVGWEADTDGDWKDMNIQLMTGSNLQMQPLTTVATVDGTDPTKTTFTYTCPDVTPHAAIYFYQFSSPAAPTNLTWTTRFTILGANGDVVDPEFSTQGGQNIPYGNGQLVDSTAVPPPTYLPPQGTTSTNASTGSSSTVGTPLTAPTSTSASLTTTEQSSSILVSASKAPAAPTNTGAPSGSTNLTNSTSGASSGANDNGAMSVFDADNHLARAGIALGVAAFTFAVAL